MVDNLFTKSYFKPKTLAFWCALLASFVLCSFLGHWLEIPYCGAMDALFNIVDPDYAAVSDPWYVPYRVYGYGAIAMTLLLEPLKERIIDTRCTLLGALGEMFLLTVFLSCALELIMGLIVNQPVDGVYPYWDNSQLPFNVLGQAWLVNDFFIGLVAMLYIWVIFPLVCTAFEMLRPRVARIATAGIAAGYAGVFAVSLPYLF